MNWIGLKILAGIIGFLTTALMLSLILIVTSNVWIMALVALGEVTGGIILLKIVSQKLVKALATGMLIASVFIVSAGFLFWNVVASLVEGILH